MKEVLEVVATAKAVFRAKLESVDEGKGLSRDVYIRYLSFQYHLTKGVQRPFIMCAAHPSLADKPNLRAFLFNFGLEEEPHYKVAETDLERLGEKPLPCPLDVSLWWAYFDRIVPERPFVRLGATCVLENLGAGAGAIGHGLLANSSFLDESNTRFLQIHFHEALPHGDQIIQALESENLSAENIADLVEGARVGAILYLRMASWALGTDELSSKLFPVSSTFERLAEDGNYLDLPDLVNPTKSFEELFSSDMQ